VPIEQVHLGQTVLTRPSASIDDRVATGGPDTASSTHGEIAVCFDLSEGRGEFVESFLVASDDVIRMYDGRVESVSALRKGDRVPMADGSVGLVQSARTFAPAPGTSVTGSAAGPHVTGRVVATVARVTDELIYLRTLDELIKTTPEHPFFVAGQGWTRAGDLRTGDRLESAAGTTEAVLSVEVRKEHATVYNMEIEASHTYYVGLGRLLVHNALAFHLTCTIPPDGLYRGGSDAGFQKLRVKDVDASQPSNTDEPSVGHPIAIGQGLSTFDTLRQGFQNNKKGRRLNPATPLSSFGLELAYDGTGHYTITPCQEEPYAAYKESLTRLFRSEAWQQWPGR
jgi:hypothetical protein